MVSGAGTLHVGDSPSPRVSLNLSQPVFSPAAWTLMMRLVLTATRCPVSRKSNQRIPVIKSPPTRPDAASSQTQRMRVMGPRTLLQLLSGILVLIETRAGECGVGRERRLRRGARGPPGSLGGRTPGNERPRGPCPDPPPPRVPACPSLAPRSLFSTPFEVRTGFRPLPSRWLYAPSSLSGPSPRTRAPRREEVGPGLTPPRPQAPTP